MNAIELRKTNGLATQHGELTEWDRMRQQAKTLVDSGFLPKAINTPEKALAVMQTGKELGLAPMQALRSIHIIDGKPTMSADLIAGLVMSRHPGAVLRVVESTNEKCIIQAGRSGQQLGTFEFSMADANRAQLTAKDNWKKYPRAMLRARCITETARAVFPDAVMGLYDPDELGAVTGPNGEVEALPNSLPKIHAYGDTHTEQGEVIEFGDPERPMQMIEAAEKLLAAGDAGATRNVLGSKARRIEGSVAVVIQAEREANNISPAYYKELSKNWQRIDKQLSKLEEAERQRALTADVTESFKDEPEEAMRQPGEEG